MNTLLLAIVGLVAFVCVGGSRVPSVLRQNKDAIVGVAIGIVLGCVFGVRLEGIALGSGDGTVPGKCGTECEAKRLIKSEEKAAAAAAAAAEAEVPAADPFAKHPGSVFSGVTWAKSLFGLSGVKLTAD